MQCDFFFPYWSIFFFFLICTNSLYVTYRYAVEIHCQVFYCSAFTLTKFFVS